MVLISQVKGHSNNNKIYFHCSKPICLKIVSLENKVSHGGRGSEKCQKSVTYNLNIPLYKKTKKQDSETNWKNGWKRRGNSGSYGLFHSGPKKTLHQKSIFKLSLLKALNLMDQTSALILNVC